MLSPDHFRRAKIEVRWAAWQETSSHQTMTYHSDKAHCALTSRVGKSVGSGAYRRTCLQLQFRQVFFRDRQRTVEESEVDGHGLRAHTPVEYHKQSPEKSGRIRGKMSSGLRAKKDGTNVFCSCREASDANYFQLRCDQEDRSPSLEYLHDTIDSLPSKYQNSDFLAMRDMKPFVGKRHQRPLSGARREGPRPVHDEPRNDKRHKINEFRQH